MTSFHIELQNALRHASETAQIADSFGFEMPAEWHTHSAVAAAAKAVADEPEPLLPPELPAPDKVPAFIAKAAGERDKWRSRVAVAAEIHERSTRAAARSAIDFAPHLAHRLTVEVNEKLIPRLTDLIDTAPHALAGYETAEQVAAHTALLRVVNDAARAAQARAQLALIGGEGADIGKSAAFIFINPGPDVTVRAVDSAVSAIANNGMPSTLEAWQMLRRLGLSVALPGEAGARRDAYNAIRANQMRTPDGGMLDHTLGELAAIERTAGTPVHGYVGATGTLIRTPHAQMLEQSA